MLRECPVCKKEISIHAAICPNCGEVFREREQQKSGAYNIKDPVHFIGSFLVFFLLLSLIVGLLLL